MEQRQEKQHRVKLCGPGFAKSRGRALGWFGSKISFGGQPAYRCAKVKKKWEGY